MFLNTETDRINRLIIQGGRTGMTELQFFAAEIKEWKDSIRRRDQLTGDMYYLGKHDILNRQRTIIGADGKLQVVNNLPNNRIVNNQYALMVDQKTNYLVGKPFTINCENKAYVDLLSKVFNRRFQRLLKYVCEDALNGGIGWMYPYYDDKGRLNFKHFPAYDILPFWADDDHTILDCAIRLYSQEVWNGYQKEKVEKVEIFKPDGLWRYIYQNDMLIPDTDAGAHENYFAVVDGEGSVEEFNWTEIPLIPFKYNKQELPLINRVKTIQDGINTMLSDFENNMQEDARNTILILKNYDGQDLGEFRHNLSTFGAVKVRNDGGVETLQIEINAENYKSVLELMKKALIENARGYDAKDDRLSGNPNQMNIQSMYSDIDLDANGMETEFQAAFEQLLWFINQDFSNRGKGDFDGEDIQITFDRDIGFDAFVDGAAMLNLENLENVSIFGFVHPTDVAKLRKALKEDLKYVEAFAKQGYVGTVGGINIYTKKNADPGKVVIGTKEAVTLFNKKGTEVEQEREGNIRKNTVYSRKYYLAAMTNEAKAVKIIVGSAKTTADETVQSKKVYYKPSGIGYVVGTPKTNPKTEGFYEITAA